MIIQIKNEVIEWLQERLGIDADEALEFAQEFAGMLYFSGAFTEPVAVDQPGQPTKEDEG